MAGPSQIPDSPWSLRTGHIHLVQLWRFGKLRMSPPLAAQNISQLALGVDDRGYEWDLPICLGRIALVHEMTVSPLGHCRHIGGALTRFSDRVRGRPNLRRATTPNAES